ELEEGVLISGTVLDPSKEPRPGVLLALYSTKDGEFDSQCAKRRPLWVGITGDDGSYEFRLHPDRYWLVLNNQPSTGHLLDVSSSKLNSDLTIDDVCLLKFEVVSETDEPIPNCQVSFEAYETNKAPAKEEEEQIEEIALPVFTDNHGNCSFTLPQGVYSFDFHPPEHSSFSSRLIRQLSVGADMSRKVRLLAKESN
ncbi:MAG: carboxypeptidase-like regulatory domain-containing protein, partial [Candidatus Obscuribacterales bacterium]|nr:carboxypeptidase-like regulatory domain-containing protein [Candidatus Obscuribacterales bacterium]